VSLQDRLDRLRERLARGRGAESSGVESVARGAGQWLTRAGSAVAKPIRSAALAVEDAWFALPLALRQRLAAATALAALIALFALVLIPAAPCGFPAGDRCPPEDDAIAIVPADAGAYLHLNLDPGTDQYEIARPLAERLPDLASLATSLLPLAADRRINYERDVRPWSGGEVAVVVDTDGAELGRMLMFEVDDGGAAIEFAERALGPELGTAEVDGITLITDDAGRAAAIRAGFLLIGPESLVRRSVELSSDDSLAADQVAQQALGKLPAERLAEAYLSAPLAAALAGGDELAPLDAFVNSGASQGAAAALLVEEDAIGVAIRSVLDPERSESDPGTFAGLSPFEPTLTSRVAGDALVYLGVDEAAAGADALVGPAVATAPDAFGGLTRFSRRLERRGDVDLERDLLPLLPGEVALTVEPDEPPAVGAADDGAAPGVVGPTAAPYLALLAKGVDVPTVLGELAELQAPIAGAIDRESGPFKTREIGGVEAQSLSLSPVVDLTYAGSGDELIVATSPGAVERYLSGAEPLADTGAFEKVTRPFADEVSLLLYLGFRDLLALGERLFLAEDPTYARYAVDLRTLDAAALAVTSTPSELNTDARVTVGEPQEP
jgi:hypothetical protein